MTYTKQTWANGPAGLTPISAARLDHIEDGIEDALPLDGVAVKTGITTFANAVLMGEVPHVDPRSLGADNTGASNAMTALTNAVAAAAGGTVLVTKGTYLVTGTGTITIPPGTNFIMDQQAIILDGRTGGNPLFDIDDWAVNQGGKLVFRQRRQTRGWDTGADTNSVGVKLTNSCLVNAYFAEVSNYETGILLYGDNPAQGCAYNHLVLGRVVNNKRGIRYQVSGAGFTNENHWYSGVIRIDGGMSSLVGTRLIDLSEPSANGNTFDNVCIEGTQPEKAVVCGGDWNTWKDCRQEGIVAGGFHFLAGSSYNMVFMGFGNYGPGSAHFLDSTVPFANSIIGSKGMRIVSDSSSGAPQNGGFAAYEATPFFSAADVIFRTRNTVNQKTWEALASGIQQSYAPGETFPRLLQDPNSGPGGAGSFKAGRGNIAPDAQWGRASGNGAAWLANCPIASASGITAARPDPTILPMGAIWFDTTLGQHIYTDTAIWRKTRDGTAA